ncbi:MAG: hypothetical protein NTX24_04540 [Candidatus Pacearchaeota archaeon]|nr:hypothetical protein [Candidatus Pacearchaeota archaeon]
MSKKPIPTNIVIEMNKRGYNDVDIIRYLKQQGFTPIEMNDAFNAAKIKMELSRAQTDQEATPVPQAQQNPQGYGQSQAQYAESAPQYAEETEAEPAGDYSEEIKHLQVRIKEIENKTRNLGVYLENLQKRLAAKFQENSTTMNSLSSQVNALQQSFSKILEPLVHGVKIKTGMLDLNKKDKGYDEELEESPEEALENQGFSGRRKSDGFSDEIKVITETKTETKTKKPQKPKKEKKEKPGLEDHFKR